MTNGTIENKLPALIDNITRGATNSRFMASWSYGKIAQIDLGEEGKIKDVYVEVGNGVTIEWTEVDPEKRSTRRISKPNRPRTELRIVEERESGEEVGYVLGDGQIDNHALIVAPFVDHPEMIREDQVSEDTQRRVLRQLQAIGDAFGDNNSSEKNVT